MDSYVIPHQLIEFELIESLFISDNRVLAFLTTKLQSNGFKVLMDDFGSGYSSLNSLKDIPVNVLKIDIKFLPANRSDKRAIEILKAVVY